VNLKKRPSDSKSKVLKVHSRHSRATLECKYVFTVLNKAAAPFKRGLMADNFQRPTLNAQRSTPAAVEC
jgi:hypothetical protein